MGFIIDIYTHKGGHMGFVIDIQLKTGNSAFQDNPEELEFISKQIARLVLDGSSNVIRDSNGNRVGTITISEDK